MSAAPPELAELEKTAHRMVRAGWGAPCVVLLPYSSPETGRTSVGIFGTLPHELIGHVIAVALQGHAAIAEQRAKHPWGPPVEGDDTESGGRLVDRGVVEVEAGWWARFKDWGADRIGGGLKVQTALNGFLGCWMLFSAWMYRDNLTLAIYAITAGVWAWVGCGAAGLSVGWYRMMRREEKRADEAEAKLDNLRAVMRRAMHERDPSILGEGEGVTLQ